VQLPNEALWSAFEDGRRFITSGGTSVTMRTWDAGALVLPTGRLTAYDPLLYPWVEPFTVRVAPGTYPVYLASPDVGHGGWPTTRLFLPAGEQLSEHDHDGPNANDRCTQEHQEAGQDAAETGEEDRFDRR
jgi:hypothetical protein